MSGKRIYRRLPSVGPTEEKSTLIFYDLEKREDKTILDDVTDSLLAAKGEKLLVRRKDEYAIIEPKEGQKFEKKVPVSGLETLIDPVSYAQTIADGQASSQSLHDAASHAWKRGMS